MYRHVHLVRTAALNFAPDGVFAYSNISSVSGGKGSAVLHSSAEVRNLGDADAAGVTVRFTLFERATGAVVARDTTATALVPAGGDSVRFQAATDVGSVQLWQVQNPALYTLQAEVLSGSPAAATDARNTTVGFRSLRFDANEGMFLNGKHMKVRGFCDHNDFGSFGMAVPDRIKLFRAQASRSVGGNGRRTSHNAPDPIMLDIYDRLGMAVMDENRQLSNTTENINEMKDLVARDRNHPSVTIWSFCNEAGCEQPSNQAGGPAFQAATYALDGSRPTLANMFTFGDLLSNTIDVQGFSHQSRQKLESCHAALPNKPIYASECCSCNTMRGEQVSMGGAQRSFNADCQQGQTNASNGVDYAVGTMVWTLFEYVAAARLPCSPAASWRIAPPCLRSMCSPSPSLAPSHHRATHCSYYGEPSNGGWPYVSSTFGAFDLAGFAKAASYWFRSQWLYAVPDSSPDKTFVTGGLAEDHMVHVVETWEPASMAPIPLPAATNNTFLAGCDGSVRQQFRFSGSADGHTPGTLRNSGSLCLESKCASINPGCYPIQLVPCVAGDAAQQWKRGGTAGDAFESVSAAGGCLDVFGGGSAPRGSRAGIYQCNNGPNQQWAATPGGSASFVSGDTCDAADGCCLSDAASDVVPVGEQRTIHVYSSAPFVELFANGASLGTQPLVAAIHAQGGQHSWAQWDKVDFVPGDLKAVARPAANSTGVLATHVVKTSGAPAAIALTLDCPSPLTGTGSALLLDGQDAALLRASVLDAAGNLCHNASHNVSFHVVSGPGRVVGAHNGDPKSHEPTHGTAHHTAYHGLVRGAIMVTSNAALAATAAGQLMAAIDVDGDHRGHFEGGTATPIVIEASAPGLASATFSIPTSLDAEADGVLATADKYGGAPVLGFD